ncbi:MAG: hypothetical protein HGGPFJEG_01742 [Ignavibacteria bacterium]|nr:hypothetical protein [Ignavibacteria bacterium]
MAKLHHTEDNLMAFYYKAVDYFEKNKKHVYIALTIIAVAVAGIIFLNNKRKANEEKAAVELSKIQQIYSAGKFQQAINGDSLGLNKGLLALVNDYGSTESGELAKIMLANSYFNLRDFDNAEKYYNDFSGNNILLKVSAEAGEASVKEAREQYGDAAKLFEKAANLDSENPFRDQYLFYAAKNYFRVNEMDKAKKLLEEIKEKYPKSKVLQESEKYRLAIKNQ